MLYAVHEDLIQYINVHLIHGVSALSKSQKSESLEHDRLATVTLGGLSASNFL